MTDDDFQGFIDPPSPFSPLEVWEEFEQTTLRSMNPNWPTTKALYEDLRKRREKEPWFQEIYARERAEKGS